MGENSKIEWCHHTFNPWIGCTKVSDGCANCYAEEMMDHRYGRAQWGPGGTRVRTSDTNWKKPLLWDRAAAAAGERHRVFCASLADVFEDRPELETWRYDLFFLIEKTPHLDWLLLTKRPENVVESINPTMLALPNVWIGTSVENQEQADKRIPELLKIPAAVRFLSMEPLLGPVDLSLRWDRLEFVPGIHWVIVGGESGRNARPMHPDWARGLRDQCQAAGVPFLMKQWGEWTPENNTPTRAERHSWGLYRVGKHAAGRSLDGRTWDEFPAVDLEASR